jgi:hypothetical protein
MIEKRPATAGRFFVASKYAKSRFVIRFVCEEVKGQFDFSAKDFCHVEIHHTDSD